MSDFAFTKLFPIPWRWRPYEAIVIQEVILDWLEVEVDPDFVASSAILQDLSGWRTRETWEYVKRHDWTESLYSTGEQKLYQVLLNEGSEWRNRSPQ